MAQTTPLAPFDACVFVNCPFDNDFKPLFHALLFAVHDCGFIARHALQEVGGRRSRLAKICQLIEQSRWSIHDLGQLQSSPKGSTPRLNMPFECGLAYGAMHFSKAQNRDFLLMTAQDYEDKKALSDLAGIDAKYHRNQAESLIAAVRGFLANKRKGVRGHQGIFRRFQAFQNNLPDALKLAANRHTLEEVQSLDYIAEWTQLATRWMQEFPD